ncbi:hypothetical protein EJP67_10570 [Variovorax guangxiensis]|uniref:Uncharacterized protein n=1 Tax=Variovorax guangxiensis TaxID=1775474 RepID=A0A433MIG6_9BURK|nr:hypothetical protein [Variovorax guangxiensis]RUR67505.1 hypothetical protein EJP67_10570 [Variovorax guangxiensis]
MILSSQFRVVVEEVSPGAFAWAVVEHKEAEAGDRRIAQSQKSFPEFDVALEEGFAALKALPQSPRAG